MGYRQLVNKKADHVAERGTDGVAVKRKRGHATSGFGLCKRHATKCLAVVALGAVLLAFSSTSSHRVGPRVVETASGNSMNLRTKMDSRERHQKKAEKEHQEYLDKLQREEGKLHGMEKFIPPLPYFGENVVFSGHLVPDADSIASSVAAAYLWNGTAMFSGKLNAESRFLLDFWNVDPRPVNLEENYNGNSFVIVDHNAFAQRPKTFVAANIMGILDHHALSGEPTLVPEPVFLDIRPWGSCSTVIATKFLEHLIYVPPEIAGLLLGGLLSDTLNLKSPTATPWDAKVRTWLAKAALWPDPSNPGKRGQGKSLFGADLAPEVLEDLINEQAKRQFVAKANLTNLSLLEIAGSDFKRYKFSNSAKTVQSQIGVGVIETVEPFYDDYLSPRKLSGLARTAIKLRAQNAIDHVFIAIIDIERQLSHVLCSRKASCDLLDKAFQSENDIVSVPITSLARANARLYTTSPRVSRKKDFMPLLRAAVESLSS